VSAGHLTEREQRVADLYGDLHRHASDSFAGEYLLPGFRRHLAALGLDPEVALRGRSFLDAGCGGFAGGVAVALALGASPIVGVDLSADNIAEARRRLGETPHVHLRQENLLSLTTDSDAFDFVYCNGVLHHTEAPERAFRELVRVLKPGGRIYIGVYGRGGLFNEVVVPAMKCAGRLVPRRATARLVALVPRLGRPSSSLMDFMYVPIEVHYRRPEIERWFTNVGMNPVCLRHYYQPDSIWNRLLFGEGTMLFFSGVKSTALAV
jgi:SAM-dependent methyltransferase